MPGQQQALLPHKLDGRHCLTCCCAALREHGASNRAGHAAEKNRHLRGHVPQANGPVLQGSGESAGAAVSTGPVSSWRQRTTCACRQRSAVAGQDAGPAARCTCLGVSVWVTHHVPRAVQQLDSRTCACALRRRAAATEDPVPIVVTGDSGGPALGTAGCVDMHPACGSLSCLDAWLHRCSWQAACQGAWPSHAGAPLTEATVW